MRGYEDLDGWRLLWVAYFVGRKLVCKKVNYSGEHVHGKGKLYPKTALAGKMMAQTMGTARGRLTNLS